MNIIRMAIAFLQHLGPAYRAGQAENARQIDLGRWLHENEIEPVTEEDRICLSMYLARRDGI